ncbi:MAG: NAD-dependent epimerase/dehydratase family protein [Chlorobi bacterium]|nr:NAD-dependent epimerase/dehydratase family protein [Chlorobiota bacterium]MCI0716299.1 NAD-dependent epimerase/dehydratase family protein [Chlorobiota bacterium]
MWGEFLTEELIKAGNHPVLFNRGKRNPDLFPELRRITGDRLTSDLKQIANQSWDVVVDFSCMFPDNLEEIIVMLRGKVSRYIFVSTASVYPFDNAELWKSPVNENTETLPCTPEQRADKDMISSYGEKKAECERVLLDKDWLDSIIFRPALIYGRYDPTDRFYYWLYKVKTQNEILIPDEGKFKATNTYSEDFAKLIQSTVSIERHNKVYNSVTHLPVSLKKYLEITAKLLNKTPKFISADWQFLEENKVEQWADLPLTLKGMDLVLDNSNLIADFPVTFQSFENSIKGCIDYYSSLGWPQPKYGLNPLKERELLKKIS